MTQGAMKVERLLDFVDYQEGAVVSREVVRRPVGTVTIFAFDKGQGLSEHTAPFDALVLVLEGQVEVRLSGEPHQVGAGGMLLMPAGVPHALSALERFKMLLVMLKAEEQGA